MHVANMLPKQHSFAPGILFVLFVFSIIRGMATAAMALDKTYCGVSGTTVAKLIKNALKRPAVVDIIFVPGMGAVRDNEAYEFWSLTRIWFDQWTTFHKGQDCYHRVLENMGWSI